MKVVALPYLHDVLCSSLDVVFGEHKLCELDVEQLKQASRWAVFNPLLAEYLTPCIPWMGDSFLVSRSGYES